MVGVGNFYMTSEELYRCTKLKKAAKALLKICVPESTITQTSCMWFSLLDQRKKHTAEKNYSCEA